MKRTYSHLGLTFFGLTPKYRDTLFSQIHDLIYHGKGGFIHSEVYNMPIWLRHFHINKINKYHEKQNEEIEKQNKQNSNSVTPSKGPNLPPPDVYNF